MTISEKYSLAKWVIKIALRGGAQELGVLIFDSLSNSVEVRESKIDKLEQANKAGLTVRLLVDQKYSAHSTNRLGNRSEIERFILGAISSTRYLSKDIHRALPDPELYYRGGGKDLLTFDKEFISIDPQKRIDTAFKTEREILGSDKRILSLTCSYSDGMSNSVMLTSNGFEGDISSTYYGINASVSVDGGDARPQAGWTESALFNTDLLTEGVARRALRRALSKIGQKKIRSGKMSMIVENRLGGQLLGPLISALSGSAIQQNNSFLVDSLGKKIGSDKLMVIDDPGIMSGRGSKHFDSEGLALSERSIFQSGVLKSYYIDTYYGRKLNMSPVSGSTSNLVFGKGLRSQEDLVESIKEGIMVTGFNGGNTNGVSGDFSYGIEGFLIRDGKLVKPVSEMNITGNMKQLWMNLYETGNDPYESSAWRIPTLEFKDVDFSGL
jgi:PmbA protein